MEQDLPKTGTWNSSKMKAIRWFSSFLIILVPSAYDYHHFYDLGRYGTPQDAGIGFMVAMLLIPFFLVSPLAVILPVKDVVLRIAAAVGAALLSLVLVFVICPAGGATYANAFGKAVEQEVGLEKVQNWAEEAIKKYNAGELTTITNALYWSPGDLVIVTNELPRFLTEGLFAPSGFDNYGPEVSICTNQSFLSNCIAISWYDHGFLVGPSNFINDWKADYVKELKPGFYLYYQGK